MFTPFFFNVDSGDQGSLENQGSVFSQLKTHFATQYVDQNTLTNLPAIKETINNSKNQNQLKFKIILAVKSTLSGKEKEKNTQVKLPLWNRIHWHKNQLFLWMESLATTSFFSNVGIRWASLFSNKKKDWKIRKTKSSTKIEIWKTKDIGYIIAKKRLKWTFQTNFKAANYFTYFLHHDPLSFNPTFPSKKIYNRVLI